MIKGVGIDSVEVERVKKIVDKGDAFAKKSIDSKRICSISKDEGQKKS